LRHLIANAALTCCCAGATAHASDVANAVMSGNATELRSLLEQRADVNEAQPDGATGLHWAVYHDDLPVAHLLIEAGAEANVSNREGVTPLALAAVNGNAEMIELLLGAGADANEKMRNGETPLMMAARTGSVAAIEVLLDDGAEIDTRETLRGTTALMWAAAYRNPAAVQALIDHGADYSAKSNVIPRGRRPYLAPSAKARIEAFHRGEGQAGTSIPVDLDDQDQTGFTDADLAVAPRAEAPVEQADDGEDEERLRPVSSDPVPSAQGPARAGDETTGSGELVRQSEAEWGGLTPLIFAVREGDVESARILLEAGADVNQTSEYGWTPLLTATQNRYYELGKFLLDNGADPNIGNKGQWTPLYIATDNRNIEGGDYPTRKPDMDHLEYINLLLEHGADPNGRMNSSTETRTIFTHQWLYEEGATAFLRAAQSGDLTLMKLLLEHGADPNIPTYDGVTPLMVASGIGWVEGVTFEWSPEETFEAVELLLELEADVNAQDTLDERTALMGAAHKGRNDIVQLLVDHGADLETRDIGSRDSIHVLAGVTWQAVDYADGLVRVGVQSAIQHPETGALLRKLMQERGLPIPEEGRTLDSICVTDLCK
jgi:ankyrin repeat protein